MTESVDLRKIGRFTMALVYAAACDDLARIDAALGLNPDEATVEDTLEAIAALRAAPPAPVGGEMTDKQILTLCKGFFAKCYVDATPSDWIALVRAVIRQAASLNEGGSEPASHCDPTAICDGCQCKYANRHPRKDNGGGVSSVPFCKVEDVFDNDSLLTQLGVKRGDKLYTRPQPVAINEGGKGEGAEEQPNTLTDAALEQWADYALLDVLGCSDTEMRYPVERAALVKHARALLAAEQPKFGTGELTDEQALDLYDEIESDLGYLFGRASKEGHEAGQDLAKQVTTKMQRARSILVAEKPKAVPMDASTRHWVECAAEEGDAEARAILAAEQPGGEAAAAIHTLQTMGFTYHGGKLWAPRIGKVPPSLAEQPSEDKRDAERYNALRKSGDVSISIDHGDYTQYIDSGEELDAVADDLRAAIAKGEGK